MIEFHADDYGLFPEASRRIIECANDGYLSGISIMPNSPRLEECMEILKKECKKELKLTIHLNLVEGKPLSPAEEVPDLINEEGNFDISFEEILLANIIPGTKSDIKAQIKTEFKRQIDNCLKYFPEGKGIRLDSHRHYHCIPLIFDIIDELIKEEDYDVTSVRITREKPEFYKGILKFEYLKPINVVKAILLNTLCFVDKIKHGDLYSLYNSDFSGVMFSGHMTYKNLVRILKNISSNRDAFKENIELLFHPGAVLEEEDADLITDASDASFMTSGMRLKEGEAVKRVKK